MMILHLMTYPSGHSYLGDEDIHDEQWQEDGTENPPAEPPVDTQVGIQHEVDIPGESTLCNLKCKKSKSFSSRSKTCSPLSWETLNYMHFHG